MNNSTNYPELSIHIYADGSNREEMLKAYQHGLVKGFTTNPSLMAKAKVANYESFAKEILRSIPDAPISFEVFSDELDEMKRQAQKIRSWGANVYVKIPVMNTKQVPTGDVIRDLLSEGTKLNITAILTLEQLQSLHPIFKKNDDVILSIFAGRIADTGRDPLPIMSEAVKLFQEFPKIKILWASTRETWNIYQANACGCHIITAPWSMIEKLSLHHKDLHEYSLETVKTFYQDAISANFSL